jgi:hypothetical protein
MTHTTSYRINASDLPVRFSCHPSSRSIVMNKPTRVTNLKRDKIHD